MIFYFSGTGNSKFVAKELLSENENLISMSKAVKKNEYVYDAKRERVGFVFPVYFYTVPAFVENFIDHLELKNTDYVYAVITCGGSIKQAGVVFKKLLAKKGIKLSYVKEQLMPDNSMLFYQIHPDKEAKGRIEEAKKNLVEIKEEIVKETKMNIGQITAVSDLLGVAYKNSQSTSKFWVEKDKCIGCGLCANNCPESVIEFKDNYPVWVKGSCCKCSGCINNCPKDAIQYGKATLKRNRYSFNKVK